MIVAGRYFMGVDEQQAPEKACDTASHFGRDRDSKCGISWYSFMQDISLHVKGGRKRKTCFDSLDCGWKAQDIAFDADFYAIAFIDYFAVDYVGKSFCF